MQYGLNITIDDAGLKAIYRAGQSVVVAKEPINHQSGSDPLVAWISFQPLKDNILTWIENYYLYATTAAPKPGDPIPLLFQTADPVQTGVIYTFTSGQFTSGGESMKSVFTLINNTPSPLYDFGLAQEVTVNGQPCFSPLNIIPVLYNCKAEFSVSETVAIFLSPASSGGVMLKQVAGNVLRVTLSGQSPTANIGFNDSSESFFLLP